MRRQSALIPLLFLGFACGDGDVTPAGDLASVPSLTFEPVARIGSVDDPDQLLTRVGTVLIGPEDEVYVAQPDDGTIRVFGPDGAPLRSIGRRGGGPGEFRVLGSIAFTGDTLIATGWGSISRFLSSGRFVETRTWQPPRILSGGMILDVSFPSALALLPDGDALVVPAAIGERAVSELTPGVLTDSVRTPVLRVGPGAEIVDTVVWGRNEYSTVIVARAGRMYTMASPFSDAPLVALLPDGSGVVVVDRPAPAAPRDSATFRVSVLRAHGDTTMTRTITYPPLPLRDADVSRVLERQTIYPRQDPPAVAEFAAALRAAAMLPAVCVPVTALAAGQDGTIWLRREEAAGDAVAWLVLDPAGAALGEVPLPGGQTVVAATGERLVALEHDSLDVPFLVLGRIHRR